MKCNKCLKTIPKGEEIRFSAHDSSYRGDGGGYSGCYCEKCWKASKYYEKYEVRGKKGNSDNLSFPWWAWLLLVITIGAIILTLVVLLFKDKD